MYNIVIFVCSKGSSISHKNKKINNNIKVHLNFILKIINTDIVLEHSRRLWGNTEIKIILTTIKFKMQKFQFNNLCFKLIH